MAAIAVFSALENSRRAIADIINLDARRNDVAHRQPVADALFPVDAPHSLTFALLPLSAPVLRALRPDWQALEKSASVTNPFMEADFVAASLPLFASAGEPRLLEVRDGATLIGVMIAHVAERFARLPIPFACQTLHLHQFVGAPLVRAGREHDYWRTVFGWLDTAPTHLRGMRLRRLPAACRLAEALLDVAAEEGRFARALDGFDRAVEHRAHPGRQMSSRRALAIRRQREKLEQCGRIEIEALSAASDLAGWTEDFIDLEHRSWKGAWGTSIHQRAGEAPFYRDLLARLFDEGRLRFMRLALEGQMIAAVIDIAAGDELFAIKRAFDPAFRKFSPGVVLEQAALDAFRADARFQTIDSCENRLNAVLDRCWNARRRYSDFMIARCRQSDALAIRAAFGLIDAKAASERLLAAVLRVTC